MTDDYSCVKLLLNRSIIVWNIHCKDRCSLKNHIFNIIYAISKFSLMNMACLHFAISLSSAHYPLKAWQDCYMGEKREQTDLLENLWDNRNNLFLNFGCLEDCLHQWINSVVYFTNKWSHVLEVKTVNVIRTRLSAAERPPPLLFSSFLVLPSQDEWSRIGTFHRANDEYKFQHLPYCSLHN